MVIEKLMAEIDRCLLERVYDRWSLSFVEMAKKCYFRAKRARNEKRRNKWIQDGYESLAVANRLGCVSNHYDIKEVDYV